VAIFAKYYYDYQLKEHENNGACGMSEVEEKYTQNFGTEI
jgi:hypothetical protein